MRLSFAAAALSLLVVLVGCLQPESGAPGHPNAIIVRQFAYSTGVVALDPSFGFSLYRGAPGVPPQQRAAAVGRAAAFSLADAVVEQLTSLGYDAIRSDTASAEPGGRALIVTGAFRHIDEGRRRQNAGVVVEVEVDFQAEAGSAPQRLTAFRLDSQRIRREPLTGVAARHGANVNAAAISIGHEIARYATDLARLNKWPGAAR
ncbi:MAG TPA: hypothetical protein VGQ90_08810 [Stellaceae bacterium]|nr:hypothetical protein [Stellaceae bacterium]